MGSCSEKGGPKLAEIEKTAPSPLTVTTRPRGLERPRRRRRSEPFSTPKRHFLTETGRPARPLDGPSCTQRHRPACKVEPRAWEAQAETCSMERMERAAAGSLHLETPAKGHFDISSLRSAPAKPRKQSSECTRNQPCTRSRAIPCIDRKQAHSVVDGVVYTRCQQRGCNTEISSSLGDGMPEHTVPAVGHWAAPRSAHMDAR